MWHLRARDLHPALGRFLSADPGSPNAPGTQGYNRYAYVANNPSTWVDPSGYAVDSYPTADMSIKALMYAMGGGGFAGLLQCLRDERCRGAVGLLGELGSGGEKLLEWTAESLYEVFFSTYPHEPKPASPEDIAASLFVSNSPIAGDLYDLWTGTGARWARLRPDYRSIPHWL